MENSASSWDTRIQKLNSIKQQKKIDGLLMLDNRGHPYYNNGMEVDSKTYQIHSLFKLSKFFFPAEAENTDQKKQICVIVEGVKSKNIVRETQDGDIMVMKTCNTIEGQ